MQACSSGIRAVRLRGTHVLRPGTRQGLRNDASARSTDRRNSVAIASGETATANRPCLRVLGSSGGFPAMGLPCSGYLLASNDERILFDCGPGVAAALLQQS